MNLRRMTKCNLLIAFAFSICYNSIKEIAPNLEAAGWLEKPAIQAAFCVLGMHLLLLPLGEVAAKLTESDFKAYRSASKLLRGTIEPSPCPKIVFH